ncbi:MAG: RluA family pseudouridine synthase [Lachnospiraceae bacterium]|nr:RluA family pseudouridine synthase [Lachnospiraceae bacterium]
MQTQLEIIYEDNDILLCRKPAGIATQTKRLGQQDMESLLKNYRAKKGEQPYIGVVHRLDQPVEGLMVFGKNQKATSVLSQQIQQKIIGKYYYAVANNRPMEEQGVLEHYLLTDKKTNVTKVVENIQEFESLEKSKKQEVKDILLNNRKEIEQQKSENILLQQKKTNKNHRNNKQKNFDSNVENLPKFAKLEYRIIKTNEKKGHTLFDIKLHTGRQHQIRVQMANMGCPLVGDTKYGTDSIAKKDMKVSVNECIQNTKEKNENNISTITNREYHTSIKTQLALCSYRLEFLHPITKKPMNFQIVPKGEVFQVFFNE